MYRIGNVTVERDVPAQMRDGVTLYSDVYRPDSDAPLPVILMRVPYDKTQAENITYDHPLWYARQGYMVVVQDTRGRWTSEGEFYPFRHEMTDGYDTVEWAAGLPGSNGKVGMYGFSYVGATQLLAAVMRPPHLTCIAPANTSAQYYDGWAYNGGAFALAFNLSWSLNLAMDTANRRGDAELEQELWGAFMSASDYYGGLPLTEFSLLQQENIAPYFFDWLEHTTYDDYWKQWSIEDRYEQIEVPTLHIGGWYDIFRDGTLQNFTRLQREARSELARQNQKLFVGPWYHMPILHITGDVNFGEDAYNIVDDMQLRWFDYWLKGEDNGVTEEPPVRIFVMGENTWRNEEQWPPAGMEQVTYYFHSAGRANSLNGNGTLDREVPGDEPLDIYTYDPRFPVPSLGGHSCCFETIAPMGPADQRPAELQNQVLVYTSEPLDEDLAVIGPVTVTLWAASSAIDTDFTAKLVDVHPDGRAINLTEGIIRARHRNSLETPELLEPNEVYQYAIEVGNTCNVFKAGHRIRVEISSSNFPHWDRNTNSGNVPGTDTFADMVVATQRVFHDHQRPSHITLPVLS